MIVADTSALIAVLQNEADAVRFATAIAEADFSQTDIAAAL